MDEREIKLPQWAQQLIKDLRVRAAAGNEPLVRELTELRPRCAYLKTKCQAYRELIDCAAKGGHLAAHEILNVLDSYSFNRPEGESS